MCEDNGEVGLGPERHLTGPIHRWICQRGLGVDVDFCCNCSTFVAVGSSTGVLVRAAPVGVVSHEPGPLQAATRRRTARMTYPGGDAWDKWSLLRSFSCLILSVVPLCFYRGINVDRMAYLLAKMCPQRA